MHTRSQYMAKTSRRISKGAWERLNTAYAVHVALDSQGRPRFQIVDYERNEDGSVKLGMDGKRKPLVKACHTNVLLPESVKSNRKLSMHDRFDPKSKRARYKAGNEVGVTK